MPKLNGVVLTAVLVLAAEVCAQRRPPGYEIIQLTDNDVREAGPRINDRGQIVYEARLDGTVESGELFLFDNSTGQTVRLTSDRVRDAFPDISGDGTIVWTRFIGPPDRFGPTGEIMIRTPEGQITRLTDNDRTDWAPEINSLNHVVWYKEMGDACGLTADIFMYDGEDTFPVTTSGIPDSVANQAASLNSLDEVVWTEYNFCVDPWESRIMLYSDSEIDEISSEEMSQPQGASINNGRQVTWSYLDQNIGDHPIVIWENGSTRFVAYGRGALLNDRGDVAFSRWHDDIEAWQGWLKRDGREWRLTDDAVWNLPWDINGLGEVVWRGDAIGASDIYYLRQLRVAILKPTKLP